MTFKEKTAYVLKYAPKGDEKIQKIIKASATMDSPKSKLSADQKVKVKSAIEKLYDRFSEINKQQKTPASKKPYYTKAVAQFKKKVGRAAFAQATKGTTIAKDVELSAKKAGKRFPKAGQTSNQYGTFANKPKRPYWESRANRMDVNQPSARVFPKLAKGGKVASKAEKEKLANLAYQLQNADDGWISKNMGEFIKMQNAYKEQFRKVYGHSNYEDPNNFAKGGRTYGTGGGVDSVDKALAKFNTANLDRFESMQYERMEKKMDKVDALKVLINNTEGDFSQLSPKLAAIAKKYESYFYEEDDEGMYADGGEITDEERKMARKHNPKLFKR